MTQTGFLKEKKVAIVGCPFSGGQRRHGVDTGPHALIEAGLAKQLEGLGWEVNFNGHQKFESINAQIESDSDIGRMKLPRTVSAVTREVAEVVEKHAKAGELPLTLGGDHSLVSRQSVA